MSESFAHEADLFRSQETDAYRTIEGFPDFYELVETTVDWTKSFNRYEPNTDVGLTNLGAYNQTRLECADGTPVLVRDITDWTVAEQPGRPFPNRYYIDVPLSSRSPYEITRITLHGPHDTTPNVFTAERIIQRASGAMLEERVPLTDEEQDTAYETVRVIFEEATARGDIAFVASSIHNLRQAAGPQELLTDDYEAREAQAIINDFLELEGVMASDATLDCPIQFALRDSNSFDEAQPLRVHHVTIRKTEGYYHTITEVRFNRLDDISSDQFCVAVGHRADNDDSLVNFFLCAPNPNQELTGDTAVIQEEVKPRLTALVPEVRRRVYAAMQQQLVLSRRAVRYSE